MAVKLPYISYEIDFMQYSNDIRIESLCNSILFINTGIDDVQIKSFVLSSQKQLSIDGNFGEFNTTVYDITFKKAGGLQQLTVIRKVYADNPGTVFEEKGANASYGL